MQRRMGRGAFLGAWAVLAAAQLFGLQSVMSASEPNWWLLAAYLAVPQLLKLPIAAWRLNDLGKPPSDAVFFTLLPIANLIGLLGTLLSEGTPTERQRTLQLQSWQEQIGPFQAIGQALPLMARTLPVALPLVLVYTLVMGLGYDGALKLLDWGEANPETRDTLGSVFTLVAAGTALYTIIQFFKRSNASRLSWLPSLLFVPSLLLAIAFQMFEASDMQNLEVILLLAFSMAWQSVGMTFFGSALLVGTTVAAEDVRTGKPLDTGAAFGAVASRTLEIAAPHGGKVQAVMIGMQLLIPGIFYNLQLAFTEVIAILKPDARSNVESGQLTWNIRARLFKILLILAIPVQVGALLAVVGLAFSQDGKPLADGSRVAEMSQTYTVDNGLVLDGKGRWSIGLRDVGVTLEEDTYAVTTIQTDSAGAATSTNTELIVNTKRRIAAAAGKMVVSNRSPTVVGSYDVGAVASGTKVQVVIDNQISFLTRLGVSLQQIFFDARALKLPSLVAIEFFWALYAWALQITMLVVYHDRVRFLRARAADRKSKKEAANLAKQIASAAGVDSDA